MSSDSAKARLLPLSVHEAKMISIDADLATVTVRLDGQDRPEVIEFGCKEEMDAALREWFGGEG